MVTKMMIFKLSSSKTAAHKLTVHDTFILLDPLGLTATSISTESIGSNEGGTAAMKDCQTCS